MHNLIEIPDTTTQVLRLCSNRFAKVVSLNDNGTYIEVSFLKSDDDGLCILTIMENQESGFHKTLMSDFLSNEQDAYEYTNWLSSRFTRVVKKSEIHRPLINPLIRLDLNKIIRERVIFKKLLE